MATVDLAELSVREANEKIREFGAAGEDVDVLNPDARHHIGVGLVHPITLHIRGSAGYFCGGLDRWGLDSRSTPMSAGAWATT